MLFATAAAVACGLVVPGVAVAIPSGGAGADTPGTASSVSPRTLAAGARISFTVSGFPAGEAVNVKIDDGQFCSEAATHGACVVHVQKIRSDGTASGDFLLPRDVAPGKHWLRYLASAPILDANGNQQGIKGYTNRGDSDFTVARATATTALPPAPPARRTTAPPAAPPATSAPVVLPTSAPAVTSTPGATASALAVVRTAGEGGAGGDLVLWVVLGAALIAAVGGTVGYLIRRRPPA